MNEDLSKESSVPEQPEPAYQPPQDNLQQNDTLEPVNSFDMAAESTTPAPVASYESSLDQEPATGAGLASQAPALVPETPVLGTEQQPSSVVLSPAKSGGKKKYIIAGLVSIITVGLLGGGAFAYTTYQKPENALLEAVGKALSAKQVNVKTTVTSDFVYTAGDTKIKFDKLTFTTGVERTPKIDENAELNLTYDGKSVSLKAAVLATDKGEVYFRVSNLKDTIQKTIGADMKMTAKADEYLAKIDGKWAKYTLADLKKDNPDSAKTVQCTLDTYKKYKDDKKAIQELVDLYKKNQFVVVKGDPIVKDGNIGYVVDIDKTKSKAFEKASSDTALAKELDACDGSKTKAASDEMDTSDQATPASSEDPKTTTTVWISQWGHVLRSVETKTTNLSGAGDTKFTITTRTDVDFTKGVTTTAPSETVTFKEWSDNAGYFYGEMSGVDVAGIESRAQDGAVQSYANMVAKKAEAYNVLKGQYPATIADFEKTVESSLDSYKSMVVTTLPADQEHVAYKKCTTDTGAQVVYTKSDGKFYAYNLGRTGGVDQIVTALCK